MSKFQKMYKEKLRTAEEAVSIVKSGDWIDYAMFNGKPVVCDRALGARKDELKDIKIMAAVTIPPIPEVVALNRHVIDEIPSVYAEEM